MTISSLNGNSYRTKDFFMIFLGVVGIIGVIYGTIIYLKNVKEASELSSITVDSVYASAQVYVDDEKVGDTPFESTEIKPGQNKIMLKTGDRQYQTSILFIPATPEGNYNVAIQRDLGVSDFFSGGKELWFEKQKDSTTLRIIVEPSDAVIYIDGEAAGKTPYSSDKVSAGEYDLRITANGYEEQQMRIVTTEGMTLNVFVKLFPQPVSGEIKAFDETNNKLYEITSSNSATFSDTQTWVKSIIYWNKTRGINIGGVGLNKELVFDYYLDYKGNIFDQEGNLVTSKEEYQKITGDLIGAYLGKSDTQGIISKEAKDTLQMLTGFVSKSVTINQTPNGWLRVRNAPGLQGLEIARVNTGDKYSILEESTGWVKIQVDEQTVGWVSLDYVTISE